MAKQTIRCSDIMPGCEFKAEAESQEALLQKAAKHAAEAHNIREITPDLLTKVKSAIKTEE